jgi:CDP-diacylglycerol--serine O-phosphatidyltransferase
MNYIAHSFYQALFFAFPFIFAGAIHIIVIKRNLFSALSQVPLDLRFAPRGRRLFGKNKTLRGAVVMVAGVTIGVFLQALFIRFYPSAGVLSLVDYDSISPLTWGLLLGAGCVIGELPNSFFKRQIGIPSGGYASDPLLRATLWILDQIDSVIGIIVFASVKIRLPLVTVLLLFAVTLLIHPMGALIMVRLGLKSHV